MLKLDQGLNDITREIEQALTAEQDLTARVKEGERNIAALRKNLGTKRKASKKNRSGSLACRLNFPGQQAKASGKPKDLNTSRRPEKDQRRTGPNSKKK
jgi:cell division septum initiation protein DivIVA